MNIGVFGGSFNPPHIGHLILAQCAFEHFGLDTVLLVPTFVSPFKEGETQVSAELRSEMVALAISDNPRLQGEYWEAMHPGVSYTVDTLRHLRQQHPDATLHLIMGADTFREFHLWKQPEDILAMARLCVAERPGSSIADATHEFTHAALPFAMPLLDISSSAIRARVRAGASIQYLVPWAVKIFIEAQGLYH